MNIYVGTLFYWRLDPDEPAGIECRLIGFFHVTDAPPATVLEQGKKHIGHQQIIDDGWVEGDHMIERVRADAAELACQLYLYNRSKPDGCAFGLVICAVFWATVLNVLLWLWLR